MSKPAVLFDDQAALALKQGFDQVAELLAITLGPTQGHILNTPEVGQLELLTDSAAVARRVLALPDQAASVGAMLMRNLAWRVHLRAGDGVAASAVLAQSLLREAFKYGQAGGNPMLIKRGVDRAAQVALAALADQAQPAQDEETLTAVAEMITAEPKLSLVLGEMFDVLGPAAHITVEDYVAPYLERVYFGGGRWSAKLASPYFITDTAGRRAVQSNVAVVLFGGALKTFEEVAPLLELLAQEKKQTALLVAHEISGEALSALVLNHQQEKFKLIGAALQRPPQKRAEDLQDLALLTGATPLQADWGQSLASLKPADLGRVSRAEATPDHLIISGGGGDRTARRTVIEQLQNQLARRPDSDEEAREALRLRLARLAGGVGVLKIGAQTKSERTTRRQKAEKAIRALRLTMREGVVPGGGVAYLQTIPALEQMAETLSEDEQHGVRILARALEAPFRRLVHNRGLTEPAVALARLQRQGPAFGYDVINDQVRPYQEAGLLDPAGVLRIALETAVSGAMIAFSTGVIVLHRKPKESYQP